jgi:hypothetical protein
LYYLLWEPNPEFPEVPVCIGISTNSFIEKEKKMKKRNIIIIFMFMAMVLAAVGTVSAEEIILPEIKSFVESLIPYGSTVGAVSPNSEAIAQKIWAIHGGEIINDRIFSEGGELRERPLSSVDLLVIKPLILMDLATNVESFVRSAFEVTLAGKDKESEAIVLWETMGVSNRILQNIRQDVHIRFNYIDPEGTPGYGVGWIQSVDRTVVDDTIDEIVNIVSAASENSGDSGGGSTRKKVSRLPSSETGSGAGNTGSSRPAGTLADEVRADLDRSERIRQYREDTLRMYEE